MNNYFQSILHFNHNLNHYFLNLCFNIKLLEPDFL